MSVAAFPPLVPKVHAILMRSALADRVEVERGYATVMRKATAKPFTEDKAGEIVSIARRRRAGSTASLDQAKGGF